MAACDISKFAVSKPEDWATMARVAEQAERYEDMCAFMRQLVTHKSGGDLSVEERNLLSVAYKNVVGARRASWRTLNTDEYKENEHIAVYKTQLEHELESTCLEVLKLLESVLIPATTPPNKSEDEPRVFYLKMTGDYYRYLAEFIEGKGYDQKANEYYSQAMETAEQKLSATHPIRLGLALNYSVCHYEILKNQKAACDLAKKAFDEAISKLDQLDEASYKDSTLIMQLLRDNLTLWTSETDADEDAGDN